MLILFDPGFRDTLSHVLIREKECVGTGIRLLMMNHPIANKTPSVFHEVTHPEEK
jgi:hypothetical protein